jgi:5-methylcytosine-specific restriction endonuclease McrA
MLAEKYGVSKTCVMRWIRAAGIEVRSPSERSKIGSPKRVITEEYREKLRANIAKGRAAVTAESRKKQGLSQRGRVAPNKGKKWTAEHRALQIALRTTPEYREKLSRSKRGEANGMWRGGKNPTDKRLKHWSWKQARAACYERDNWTCRDCDVKCRNQVRIQAHHVIPRRLGGGDELENLVTLCAGCHRSREARFADALIV